MLDHPDTTNDFIGWLREFAIVDSTTFSETGGLVWLQEGFKIKELFCQLVAEHFQAAGFVQVELPFFIPDKVYHTQPQHFEGLMPYTYTVNPPDGDTSCYLRTTSETPFTYLFREWVKSTFPVRVFQNIHVFRHEKKERLSTLFRSREITPFIESYTTVANHDAAVKQAEAEIDLYSQVLNKLCVPFLLNRRPLFDTFPEAKYTVAFDVILPDKQVYQVATVHHLGDSFGRAFEAKTSEGDYIWQTSTGISGRAIGCVLALHRDTLGVSLPFSLSPWQVTIVAGVGKAEAQATTLYDSLLNLAHVNSKCIHLLPYSQQFDPVNILKYGGCLILRILDDHEVEIIMRNGSRNVVPYKQLLEMIPTLATEHDNWLTSKGRAILNSARRHYRSMSEALADRCSGIIELPHCGEEQCMQNIQNQIEPQGQVLGIAEPEKGNIDSPCGFCGATAHTFLRLALNPIDHH